MTDIAAHSRLYRIGTIVWLLAGCLAIWFGAPPATAGEAPRVVALAQLPVEARQTLELIKQGGPFPYKRDGVAFGNRERLLPAHQRGYYREYTVPSPSAKNRGARRIIAGSGGEFYYTDDHYQTFKRIRE